MPTLKQEQAPSFFVFTASQTRPLPGPDTLETISQLGYRVIAPYTRGYYPTGIPENKSYSPVDLGNDLLGFIDHFSDGPAIVIGHDWGAMAAYTAANIAPEKIRKMITVAIPHPRALKPSLSGMWAARHFITFQFRGLTKRKFRRNNLEYVDEIYRRWSPTWDFPASETEQMKEALAQPGVLEAVLGYYWSFSSGFTDSNIQKLANGKTSVPTLTIVGDVGRCDERGSHGRNALCVYGTLSIRDRQRCRSLFAPRKAG